MYHTEPPTDKTIHEWYMNSSRVAACALRNEQAVGPMGPDGLFVSQVPNILNMVYILRFFLFKMQFVS